MNQETFDLAGAFYIGVANEPGMNLGGAMFLAVLVKRNLVAANFELKGSLSVDTCRIKGKYSTNLTVLSIYIITISTKINARLLASP